MKRLNHRYIILKQMKTSLKILLAVYAHAEITDLLTITIGHGHGNTKRGLY